MYGYAVKPFCRCANIKALTIMINHLYSLTFSSHFFVFSLLSFSSPEKFLLRFRAYSCNFSLFFQISFSIFLSLFFVFFKVLFSGLFKICFLLFKLFFFSRFFVLLFITCYLHIVSWNLLLVSWNNRWSFKKLRTIYF